MNNQNQPGVYPTPINQVNNVAPVAQQAPVYSNEQQMQNQQVVNPTAELTKVEVVLDPEAIKILQEASAQFGESIVNLGIKMFAKTDVYKDFMLKEEYKIVQSNGTEIQNTNDNTMSLSTPVVTPVQNNTPAASSGPGFQQW